MADKITSPRVRDNWMQMEKFLESSKKAAEFLAGQVGGDGVLIDKDVSGDLCSQYKLVTLLLISGYTREGHRLLDRIKRDFLQNNGDFLSYPHDEKKNITDKKSTSFPMTHFWSYMNTWIAMGAHRFGRFDISVPAYDYIKKFYNPDQKAVCVSEPFENITDESTMDFLSTAHFGLLSLYMGDVSTAVNCGETLLKLMALEPNIDEELLLRISAKTGCLISTVPDGMEAFYKVKKNSPNQLYFFLGYHGIFMMKLYHAKKDPRFLDSAIAILDFACSCDKSLYTFSFCHKVAYAAALVAMETKNQKYKDLSIRLCEYLISIQTEEGLFGNDFEPIDKFDQSAEIAIWLREVVNELGKM